MPQPTPKLPTLLVDPADLAPIAIVVGDPERARRLANRLDDVRAVGANREYFTWTGTAEGRAISVSSHGVGAAGANICFVELLKGGVRAFLRAGTCGAIRPGIEDGELIVATAAVREDGVSDHLVPPGFPAVADREMTGTLVRLAAESGRPAREGIVVTEANFYPGPRPARWRRYRELGPLAVEMEMSSLFVVAALNGARAAGILTVDGNLADDRDPDMSDYDPHRQVVAEGVERMLDLAVAAAAAHAEAGPA